MEEVYRTIKSGDITINNVPHLYKNGELFPDGEDVILDGAVLYNLTKICKHMISEGIKESDYALIKERIC